MAEPLIGAVAMWTAIKAFVVAASVSDATPEGIPAGAVYRARQNAPEVRGAPASVRLWADGGAVALAETQQTRRSKLLEQWLVQVVDVVDGGTYEGEVGGAAFAYQAQPGDDAAAVRDGLLAVLPAGVAGAAVDADSFSVTATTAGVPLALAVTPPELLEAVRTRATASELRWSPGEITVQIEVVVERPRDDPDSVPSALDYLNAIVGKLAHGVGPRLALKKAGVGFMRFAMQPQDLTGLDRVTVRSRARADIVFSVDVGSTVEFDLVASIDTVTAEQKV